MKRGKEGGHAHLVEIVFIQLSHKRGEIGVLEHAREDGFCEFVHVLKEK